jgi:hypothetical protein
LPERNLQRDACRSTKRPTSSSARLSVIDRALVIHVRQEGRGIGCSTAGYGRLLYRRRHTVIAGNVGRLVRGCGNRLAVFVRAIDIESWALFIPGGIVGRVRYTFGPRVAKVAAAAELVEGFFVAALTCVVADSMRSPLRSRRSADRASAVTLLGYPERLIRRQLWVAGVDARHSRSGAR